jgi:outer membrane protein assembly factor BamB
MDFRSWEYNSSIDCEYDKSPEMKREFLIPTHFWSIPAFLNPYTVIIGAWDSYLRCYDVYSGEENWSIKIDGPIYSSPVIIDENSFLLGGEDNRLRKFTSSGELLWEFLAEDRFHSTPTIDHFKKIVFSTNYDHHVYAIDIHTGELLWKRKYNENVGEDIYSSPALTKDNEIVFGTGHDVVCLDETGTEKWSFRAASDVDSTPAIDYQSQIAVVGSNDHSVYALDVDTGKVIWVFKTGGEVATSPAIVNQIVAIGSDDGYVYGLDVRTGRLLWKSFHGHKMLCTPLSVLPDGNFCYVTLDECLWCVGSLDGKTVWRKSFTRGVHSAPALSKSGYMAIGSNEGAFYILNFPPKDE